MLSQSINTMSAVDNLPPIIKQIKPFVNEVVENLPPVREEITYKPMVEVADSKPFILVCSRELKEDELSDLQGYGKVLVFRESYLNIPLKELMQEHQFSYMLVDIHNKVHRQMLMKEDLSPYHVVCVVGYIDIHDDFVEDTQAENTVRSLPDHQAKKADFDRLLLAQKLKKPNIVKSCLRAFLRVLAGWPKE
jgi:hypothetical protein